MPRIHHSFERWKLREHLLLLYPRPTMDPEKAPIGELFRAMLCYEDAVEVYENQLELLKDHQHRSKILALYEKEITAVPQTTRDVKVHEVCKVILNQKIGRLQGNCFLINNILRKRSSAAPLAPLNLTNLSPLSFRLIKLLVLSLDEAMLDQHKNMSASPGFIETVQRELSLICVVIAGETLNGVRYPVEASSARTETLHSQMPLKREQTAHGTEAEEVKSMESDARKKRRIDENTVSSASGSSLPHPGRYPAPSTVAPASQASAQSGITRHGLSNASASSRLLRSSHQTSASSSNHASAASSNQASDLSSAPPSGPSRRPIPPYRPGGNPHPHH